MATLFATDKDWKQVKIGAGGWVTGMDIHRDGTMVARTDGAGAYLWKSGKWVQLVTASNMPSDTISAQGVYEIRIAPSNSNIFYMETNGAIYKSVDRGDHWVKTALPTVFMDANGANRMDGQKMAIDPHNPDIVFAGTQQNGLWVTRDGGAHWQQVTAVPQGGNSSDAGLTGIVIQGSTVYVGTSGNGVYGSSDGGLTWSAITGGPSDVSHAALAPNGDLFVSGNTDGALWKFAGGTWTKLIPDSVHGVTIDPFNPAHIVVVTPGGSLQESEDGGATWGGWNWNTQLESSNDVPWLEDSGKYMSAGAILFDPLTPGKLYQSAGVGVWHTDMPVEMLWNTPVLWHSQSAGIENLVPNDIIAPRGGNPVFASWDRAFIEMSDVDSYATDYAGGGFSMGWSLDYASSNPAFVVGISDYWGTENSGFSVDGGQTWQKFAGLPSFAMSSIGGSIAASTPTNFIWAPATSTAPAYTLDGGQTWTDIVLPGKTDWTNFHAGYYLKRTTITSDRVEPNTFYLYDVMSGVYATHDGGANWIKVFDGQVSPWSYWNSKIEAVPGKAGELFFTTGALDGDPTVAADIPFMHSTDGGASWREVAGVKEVTTFGYGAAAVAGGPATIYIVGFVAGEYGIFYSIDNAQSWTQIGRHPTGNLDTITTISGDMDQFGMVYVGLGGNGYVYLSFTAAAPSAPDQQVTITAALDDAGAASTVASGALINDDSPTLQGTLSAPLAAGQLLAVYRDGQRVGSAVVTDRSWTFSDARAVDGRHDYTAMVEDAAGRAGTASPGFALSIDASAPRQSVNIAFAIDNVGSSTGALQHGAVTDDTAPTLSGTVSGGLAADEMLVVFRDGVRAGVALIAAENWTFTDAPAAPGAHVYTAQVHDVAGNSGAMSGGFILSIDVMRDLNGSSRSDMLTGTTGADRISGAPSSGTKIGKGTVDVLTGNGGADLFILGDARGIFYDDGSRKSAGAGDYARITDFGDDDRVQLNGQANDYFQSARTIAGITGTGIYHDSNNNGVLDSRDELIALIQNHGPLDADSFFYVG